MSARAPIRALALALVLLASVPAHAGWRDDLGTPVLVGEGEARYWGLRLYHVALWTDHLPFDASHAFALELKYDRSISRERIVSVSIDEMARLGGANADDAAVRSRLDTWRALLMRAIIDVHEGDRLVGVYRPGAGARFYAIPAGQPERQLADIDDDGFAHAFFGIWLDPRTREPRLRMHLLGAGS
jgi:hypothetical protein